MVKTMDIHTAAPSEVRDYRVCSTEEETHSETLSLSLTATQPASDGDAIMSGPLPPKPSALPRKRLLLETHRVTCWGPRDGTEGSFLHQPALTKLIMLRVESTFPVHLLCARQGGLTSPQSHTSAVKRRG